MKIKPFIVCCLFFIPRISFSQEMLSISGVYGFNIYHSDNALPITRDNDFKNVFGFTLGYTHNLSEQYELRFDVGYLSTNAKNTLTETYYFDFGSPREFKVDLLQYSFPLDIIITQRIFKIVEVGIGVSLEGIKREVKLYGVGFPNILEDRLNIFSMGGNAILGFVYNIPNMERFLIYSDIKFRYLVSVWKNTTERDLDNFTHNFLQSNFSIGIGFKL